MPVLKGAASEFTTYKKINAQSLAPTLKMTQSSVKPATLFLNGTIGSIAKATTVAAAVSPKTAVVATSTLKTSTAKRG